MPAKRRRIRRFAPGTPATDMLAPMARESMLASVVATALLMSPAARAEPSPSPAAVAAGQVDLISAEDAPSQPPSRVDLQNALPPPTNIVLLQYGVAFTTEIVTAAGPMCDNVDVPCILGPGGGIAIRAGWRGTGAVYLGGAYEISKQDPNKLLRLALLQQARVEGRYYFVSGRDVEPYVGTGAGIAAYGNEWSVDTWGPAAFLGAGLEAQITRRTVVGLGLNYRFLYFQGFRDTTGAERAAGIAQLVGLDLLLEQRDPIFTKR